MLSSFVERKIIVPRFGLTLEPWIKWRGDQNPDWWRSYTNVKHQRNIYFTEAKLSNTLNAVAALNIVIVYFYKEVFSQENAVTYLDVNNQLIPKASLMQFDW